MLTVLAIIICIAFGQPVGFRVDRDGVHPAVIEEPDPR